MQADRRMAKSDPGALRPGTVSPDYRPICLVDEEGPRQDNLLLS